MRYVVKVLFDIFTASSLALHLDSDSNFTATRVAFLILPNAVLNEKKACAGLAR